MEYLGHVVSKDGTKMKETFIKRVVEWRCPISVKALNTFLGFTGYYRSYIPDYVMQEKFEKLKELFKNLTLRFKILSGKYRKQKFTEDHHR